MKIAVLGAGGGLGRNVVEAALTARHEVVALVRDAKRAELPAAVAVFAGDATRIDDVARAMDGADATMFCVNPPFATWLTTFQPLLDAALAGAKRTGTRLIFPANAWIYGPGHRGELVDEVRAATPASKRGALRAQMEEQIRAAGIRYAMIRLPEFYGPSVTTLTGRVFRAAMNGARTFWPGRLEAEVELVYMPDAARTLVDVGAAADCDAATFHLPGLRTTPREFVNRVYRAADVSPRVTAISGLVLSAVGVFDATVRGAADIGHLWTHPILLDGQKLRARFGDRAMTPLDDAIDATLAWHRARPTLRLQG